MTSPTEASAAFISGNFSEVAFCRSLMPWRSSRPSRATSVFWDVDLNDIAFNDLVLFGLAARVSGFENDRNDYDQLRAD